MSEPLAPGGVVVAEAPQAVVPTTENVLDQAVAVAKQAGGASLSGTPAPTIENPPLGGIGSVLPGGDMSTTAGPGAIAGQRAGEIAATQAAATTSEKRGGFFSFLGKLNPVKAEIVDRATADAKLPPKPAEVAPGLGFAPGEPKIAKIEVPVGANPELAAGTTPPVLRVTEAAQAAEASANKVLGGNSQLPDAPTGVSDAPSGVSDAPTEAPPTTGSLDAAMDEIHKTAEESWNKPETSAEPAPAVDSAVASPTEVTAPIAEAAPIVPTAIEAPVADAPVESLPEAAAPVVDATADAAAHPEIVDYDKGVAATAGEAEDAANEAQNKQPNLDLLAVTGSEASAPPVDVPAYTPPNDGLPSAEVTASALPEAQTSTPDPLAVTPDEATTEPAQTMPAVPDILSQAADVAANAEATGGALPSDGAAAPAVESPILAQANEVVANAQTSSSMTEPSTIGSQEPTTPTDILSQAADVAANAEATGGALPADGVVAPAIENPVLAQANEVVANAEAVGGALPTENSADSGNTPIEAIATPLPNVGATNENQWSASNLTGVTSAESSIPAASSEQTVATPATAVIQSLETMPKASPVQVQAPDGTTLPAAPITPTEPVAPAVIETVTPTPSAAHETVDSEDNEQSSNLTPFPAATLPTEASSTSPEISADLNTTTTLGVDANVEEAPSASVLPDNMSALPGVTPEAQTQEQITAAQSGIAPTLVNTEAPSATVSTVTPDNALAFPGVTPTAQTPEQIATAQSGIPLSAVENSNATSTPDNVLAFPGATPSIQSTEQIATAQRGIPLSTVETGPTAPAEDTNSGTGTPTAPPIAA